MSPKTDIFSQVSQVLVLAPHFDDEVISCGGAILQYRRRGCPVTVLYFSDGSASEESGLSPTDLTAVRMAEARRSNRILGVTAERYLNQPDGQLAVSEPLIAAVAAMLREHDAVYSPPPDDVHPDHRVVAAVLGEALKRVERQPLVVFYEFWEPIRPNYVLDVTEEMDLKVKALGEHASQLRFLDYIRLMKRLGEQRGKSIGVAYAEAYWVVPPESRGEVWT